MTTKTKEGKNKVSAYSAALIVKTLLPKITMPTLQRALEEQGLWSKMCIETTIRGIEENTRPSLLGGER